MENPQYIIDHAGHKTAVILPIEYFEEMLEDLHFKEVARESRHEAKYDFPKVVEELGKNIEIDLALPKVADLEEKAKRISNRMSLAENDELRLFMIRQLVLSLLDKSFDYLKIPVDPKSKRQRDLSLLLFTLVELFYYSTNKGIDRENYVIALMNKDFSKFHVGVDVKTIQTQRNEHLIPYIESNKSIIDIYLHPPRSKKGTSYRLNFLEALETAIHEFLQESNLEISEVIKLIEFSKRISYGEIIISNNVFKGLWGKITLNLDSLPSEPKIHLSNAAANSKAYQSMR